MEWLEGAAALAQLVLALMVLASGPRNPLALALALLCLDIAAWSSAALAHMLGRGDAYHFLDHALSSLTAPLALEFVLAFTGTRRSSRVARALAWGASASLGVLSFAAA